MQNLRFLTSILDDAQFKKKKKGFYSNKMNVWSESKTRQIFAFIISPFIIIDNIAFSTDKEKKEEEEDEQENEHNDTFRENFM